jgi:hypothetical protein
MEQLPDSGNISLTEQNPILVIIDYKSIAICCAAALNAASRPEIVSALQSLIAKI